MTRLFHRCATSLFLLLLLAAVAGLVGKGPFSQRRVSSPDHSFEIHYDRFVHYQSPAQLRISVGSNQTASGMIRFVLSRRFVGHVEMENFAPAPTLEVAGPDFCTYVFQVETNRPTQVILHFSPDHYGRLIYRAGLAGGPELELRHFSFP